VRGRDPSCLRGAVSTSPDAVRGPAAPAARTPAAVLAQEALPPADPMLAADPIALAVACYDLSQFLYYIVFS
jgi:hypothetical protein